MIAFRGALIVAGLCLVFPCLASAQAPPPPPPQEPLKPDPAIDELAREFVAENMPMTDNRRRLAQDGYVGVPCDAAYPNTTTTIGSTPHAVSPNNLILIRSAVDSFLIEQNLVAAGIPAGPARSLAANYRNARLRFDVLPSGKQKQIDNSRQSPRWRLVGYLKMIDDHPELPQFKDPTNCGIMLPATLMTKFRFELQPSGGAMWVVPYFLFRVCQKRGIDPYSHTACEGWQEVPDYAPLIGKYVYSAEWPKGPPRRRVTTFGYWGTDLKTLKLSQDDVR